MVLDVTQARDLVARVYRRCYRQPDVLLLGVLLMRGLLQARQTLVAVVMVQLRHLVTVTMVVSQVTRLLGKVLVGELVSMVMLVLHVGVHAPVVAIVTIRMASCHLRVPHSAVCNEYLLNFCLWKMMLVFTI